MALTVGLNTVQINAGVQQIITMLEEERTEIKVVKHDNHIIEDTAQSSVVTIKIKTTRRFTLNSVSVLFFK